MPQKKKFRPKPSPTHIKARIAAFKKKQEGNLDCLMTEMDKTMKGHSPRSDAEYDGVLGLPPDWIPLTIRGEFEVARNRILDCGYEPETVCTWIQERIAIRDATTANSPKSHYIRPGIPATIWNDIGTLAWIWEARQLGEEKGLALLTDDHLAAQVIKGKKYREHQSRIAKKPRGRVGDDGETMSEIIDSLTGVEYNEEMEEFVELSVKDIWMHFWSKLDGKGLNPKEVEHPTDLRKNYIEYDFQGERKSITYGRFANRVTKHPKKKSR